MYKLRRAFSSGLVAVMMVALIGCQGKATSTGKAPETGTEQAAAEAAKSDAAANTVGSGKSADLAGKTPTEVASSQNAGSEANMEPESEAETGKNGDVYILFTSDVHCGIDKNFGYVSVQQVRDELEGKGYTTILVDDGDQIQGDIVGTLTKGDAIIDIMNSMKYDVVIPGNHEFDYGMDRFFEMVDKAEFPYICCNFTKNDELVFEPYKIIEAAGMKIGFVGVTTPTTLSTSKPEYFQNDKGEYIYGFMEDDTGQKVYDAVQKAVDDVRKEGVDYVYLLAHLGNSDICTPWTYADVVANTSGIDVVLDGHSHDLDQVVMKNKDGEDVVRSAVGYKLNAFGYSYISADKGIQETNIWNWDNTDSVPSLLGVKNELTEVVDAQNERVEATADEVVAKSEVDLTVYDPNEKDEKGDPIRMVRRAETNLGDFCTDAIRVQADADIAIINGGGIRADMKKGDITYGDIISVFPFGNYICSVDATGQQILDALEWGARACPDEFGGFLQVSGLSYEIDTRIKSPCTYDDEGLFTGVKGKRRVKNVKVGDDKLDPKKHYKVAGITYTLLKHGDGHTAFDKSQILQDSIKLDNETLIDYIVDDLKGTIGSDYADPYGQGRITVLE